MADEDLRALERRWAEGAGDLASGDAFFRALERAGADTGRLLEVRLQVLRGHLTTVGLGQLTLSPLPEIDPLAATFRLPVDDVIVGWHRLRARVDESGAYPIVVGTELALEMTIEAINERPELRPEVIIERAAGVALTTPEPAKWREEDWPTHVERQRYDVVDPMVTGGNEALRPHSRPRLRQR